MPPIFGLFRDGVIYFAPRHIRGQRMASDSLRVFAVLSVLVVLAGCAGGPLVPATPTAPGPSTGNAPTTGAQTTATPTATAASASATPHSAAAPGVAAEVVRVVDGDTVEVRFENGTRATVRLLGVDTPEVRGGVSPEEFEGVPNTTAGRACLRRHADAASAYVKRVADGATVRLGFDPESPRRGFYDRLLAYVYVRDGGEWRQLNYRLLARGDARLYESQFVERERYAAAERRARAAERGLWSCGSPSTPAVPDGGTTDTDAPSEGSLAVATVHADAEGNDNRNPNDEYVVLRNDGSASLDLSGWTVTDAAGKTYEFPAGTTLSPGESLTLYTGDGTTRHPDYYWGREGAVWNNDGDVVTVRRADGRTEVVRRY